MIRFAPLVLLLGCKADLPQLTDANKALDVRCNGTAADTVLDFFPTSLTNTSAALGAPDGSSVTLAKDNILTLGFLGLGGLSDAQGNDVRVVAMVDASASALVRVASSDMNFQYAGTLTSAVADFDIAVADVDSALYVRLIAVGGTVRVDALEAIHDTCQ